MHYEKKVFKVADSWQYLITQDGVPSIVQDFDPELPGFEPMSEARANAMADAVIARLLAADSINNGNVG